MFLPRRLYGYSTFFQERTTVYLFMKISILMPVFNTADFLSDCLESVINQTEKDWELIAVDDFSSDESYHILKAYQLKDARIQVLQNTEKGIAPALKMAFEHSSGQLITRMDSDDKMKPDKLACLKAALLQHGRGTIATGQVEYFRAEGIGEGYRKYAVWINSLIENGHCFDEIYKECTVPSPCWMSFKDDLKKCEAFTHTIYPEDYDLLFRWRAAGFRILPEKKVLHEWRDWSERTSRTNSLYKDNAYLALKLNWFLQTDHEPSRPLVIWGAGKKGKRIARILNELKVSFGWVTNNQSKIGHAIRGIELRDFNILPNLKNPQVIIAVASPHDQKEIRSYLAEIHLKRIEHFYFFC